MHRILLIAISVFIGILSARPTTALVRSPAPTAIGIVDSPARDTLDSLAIVRTLIAEELAFITAWRTAWLRSDWDQWVEMQRRYAPSNNPRKVGAINEYYWCIYAWRFPRGADTSLRKSRLIPSARSTLPSLICPTWSVDPSPEPDASDYIDSALTQDRREQMARLRETLLSKLETAARRLPGDHWISGQRVRFLADQAYRGSQYLDEALRVAKDCRGDGWWCPSLEGYVFARRSQFDSAEVAFERARRSARPEVLCSIDNVLVLLDTRAIPKGVTVPKSCDAFSVFANTYWWLADPLWSDSINERRVEHNVRTVSLLLMAQLPKSERFDWTPDAPSDAVTQLVMRYGSPSKMFWSGVNQTRVVRVGERFEELRFVTGRDDPSTAPSPPATTQEYTPGRFHFGPSWVGLLQPFTATAADWDVQSQNGSNNREWWPIEHVRRVRPMMSLRDVQVQQWRRGDSVVLAVATQLNTSSATVFTATDRVEATLIGAKSARQSQQIAALHANAGEVVTMMGRIPFDSTIISVELRGVATAKFDARTRFALPAEQPLRSMTSNAFAMSAPALLNPVPAESTGAPNLNDVSRHLLPSTVLRGLGSVGLYWESYGLTDRDTVDTELHVERLDSPGVFERIRVALGAERELDGARIRWREPTPGSLVSESSTAMRAYGRLLNLSLATLKPGEYVVTVTVRSVDGRSAASHRLFSIVGNSNKRPQ